MKLVKTNVPGFSKNKKTNVLINTDSEKLKQVQETRKQFKKQLAAEVTLDYLQKKVIDLELRLEELERRSS